MKHLFQPRGLPSAAAALSLLAALLLAGGCALFPETRHRQSLHNPFPQLKRVAVLPFFNQSSEPTLDTLVVAEAYYAALQAIPGFEVLPVGVVRGQLLQYVQMHGEPQTGEEFQQLARWLGVEAVVVGSVTDYEPYYPPRLAMTVHWYAANEGFHPIPPGYGLPWGTDGEDEIPRRIVQEAEFALARSQLATQSPIEPEQAGVRGPRVGSPAAGAQGPESEHRGLLPEGAVLEGSLSQSPMPEVALSEVPLAGLPPQWPRPTDLIPDPPSPAPPLARASHEPVLSHTRIYRGDDAYVTGRLADYVETGDDARPSGWQGYLHRSEDYVRFCCHLHIAEMLEARGGSDQSDLILRWPLSRY